MMQEVQFVQHHFQPVIPTYRWWDKPRWWLVKLLGGVDPSETVRVVRVPIDGKTFMERMWKMRRSFIEQLRPEPTRMWIGAEDYEELMDCKDITESFRFDANFGHGRRIYGLDVTVIPWMRGMLVLP